MRESGSKPTSFQPASKPPSGDGYEGPVKLEWMLHNNRVSDQALFEALEGQYGEEIYRLGAFMLGNAAGARRVAVRTLVEVTANRHRFWGNPPFRVWFYRMALEACRSELRRLQIRQTFHFFIREQSVEPAPDRFDLLPRFLFLHCGFTEPEIALICRIGPKGMDALELAMYSTDISAAVQELAPCFSSQQDGGFSSGEKDGSSPYVEPKTLHVLENVRQAEDHRRKQGVVYGILELGAVFSLVLVLVAIGRSAGLVASPEPTPSPVPQVSRPSKDTFTYVVQPEETLDSIASKAGTSREAILRLNNFLSPSSIRPGMTIKLPVSGPWFSKLPPVNFPDPPQPLPGNASLKAVLDWAQNNEAYWSTMWADLVYMSYGPPGYAGPPTMYSRAQFWVYQPSHMRLDMTYTASEELVYQILLAGRYEVERYKNGQEERTGILAEDGDRSSYFRSLLSIDSGIFGDLGEYSLIGKDEWAGRDAWLLEGLQPDGRRSRLWIDAERGVVLRIAFFARNSAQTVLWELRVNRIVFDVNFPENTFDRNQPFPDGFAANYLGTPEGTSNLGGLWADTSEPHILDYIPPPEGFDPSQSEIIFQARQSPTEDRPDIGGIDLFADGYYLGNLALGDTSLYACTRSSNGRMIAFQVRKDLANAEIEVQPKLYWIDLRRPMILHEVASMREIREYAFDPDSRRLAVSGCSPENLFRCGVYLLYLENDSLVPINDIDDSSNLAWSPDGDFIAMIEENNQWSNRYASPNLLVVEVDSLALVYRYPINWEKGGIPASAPVKTWGIQYPPPSMWETGCLLP